MIFLKFLRQNFDGNWQTYSKSANQLKSKVLINRSTWNYYNPPNYPIQFNIKHPKNADIS